MICLAALTDAQVRRLWQNGTRQESAAALAELEKRGLTPYVVQKAQTAPDRAKYGMRLGDWRNQ
jgi:hypothetical protein